MSRICPSHIHIYVTYICHIYMSHSHGLRELPDCDACDVYDLSFVCPVYVLRLYTHMSHSHDMRELPDCDACDVYDLSFMCPVYVLRLYTHMSQPSSARAT
jgi:rRNA maturation protein Nop10